MNLTNFTLEQILTALTGIGGALTGAELVLLIGTPDYANPDLVEADLSKATFTGYFDTVVATWTQYTQLDGRPYVAGTPLVYNPVDAVNLPQTIVGAALIQGANVVAIGPLDNPIFVAVADQGFHLTPVLGVSKKGSVEFHGQTI